MTEQEHEQRYNWNEHRYDDPFKTALWMTALIFFGYLGIILVGLTSQVIVGVALLSYPIVAFGILPCAYRLSHGSGFLRYEGGALLITFLLSCASVFVLLLYAMFANVMIAASNGGQ